MLSFAETGLAVLTNAMTGISWMEMDAAVPVQSNLIFLVREEASVHPIYAHRLHFFLSEVCLSMRTLILFSLS